MYHCIHSPPKIQDLSMTGTWRDTLFVWKGVIVTRGVGQGVGDDPAALWDGNWIGEEDCADACKAELPDFEESKLTFECNGSVEKKTEEACYLSVGGEWAMQGETKIDRHFDKRHEIRLPIVKENDTVEDMQEKNVAVAVGENNFGSFISAGFQSHGRGGDMVLTLGRRYLEDGDVRSAWTLEELYEKVLETYKKLDKDHSSRLPWQSEHLHAETLHAKRKIKRRRKS